MQHKLDRWKAKVENELLNMMISETIREIGCLKESHQALNQHLESFIPAAEFSKFSKTQMMKCKKVFEKTKWRNIEKYEDLLRVRMNNIRSMVRNQWIDNISDTAIPEYGKIDRTEFWVPLRI